MNLRKWTKLSKFMSKKSLKFPSRPKTKKIKFLRKIRPLLIKAWKSLRSSLSHRKRGTSQLKTLLIKTMKSFEKTRLLSKSLSRSRAYKLKIFRKTRPLLTKTKKSPITSLRHKNRRNSQLKTLKTRRLNWTRKKPRHYKTKK